MATARDISSRRLRGERGGALVETPFAVIVMAMLAIGVVTLTQALYIHLKLSSGVRAGARYAARTDYDPASASSSRRRNEQQVRTYTVEVTAADLDDDPLTCDPRCVTVSVEGGSQTLATAVRGDEVTVRAATVVDNPLYDIGAALTNTLAGLLGQGPVLDPDGIGVEAESLAILE